MAKVKTLLEVATAISYGSPIGVYASKIGKFYHLATPSCSYSRSQLAVFEDALLDEIVDSLCPSCSNANVFAIQDLDMHILVEVDLMLKVFEKFQEHLVFLATPMSDKLDAYRRLTHEPWRRAYSDNSRPEPEALCIRHANASDSAYVIYPSSGLEMELSLLGCASSMDDLLDAARVNIQKLSKGLPDTLLCQKFEKARQAKISEGAYLGTEDKRDDNERRIVALSSPCFAVYKDALMRVYGSPLWATDVPPIIFEQLQNFGYSALQTTDDPEILETARVLFSDRGEYSSLQAALAAAVNLK